MSMKALSIKQPWASLIADGFKTIETRTWNTHYRGQLLICSSKAFKYTAWEGVIDIRGDKDAGDKYLQHMRRRCGQALAIANLVDCRMMTFADQEAAQCELYPDAHSWVLENVRRIEPFNAKGALSLWDAGRYAGEIDSIKYIDDDGYGSHEYGVCP